MNGSVSGSSCRLLVRVWNRLIHLWVVLLLGLAACASPAPAPAPPSATPAPSATPLPSRTPTATTSPIPSQTSTATPVPRWREYEVAIAEAIGDPNARCEWYILGMEAEKVYLDVICRGDNGGLRLPMILYFGPQGKIDKVWTPNLLVEQPGEIPGALGDLYEVWLQDHLGDDRFRDPVYHQNRLDGTPPAIVLTGTPLPRMEV